MRNVVQDARFPQVDPLAYWKKHRFRDRFFAAMDGAPADLVGNDTTLENIHATAAVVAPSREQVVSLAQAIVRHGKSKDPRFNLRKWKSNLRPEQQRAYQEKVIEYFADLLPSYPHVGFFGRVVNEREMRREWDVFMKREGARLITVSPCGKFIGMGRLSDGDDVPFENFPLLNAIGAQSFARNILYFYCFLTNDLRNKMLELHTDKMPGPGKGMKGLRFVRELVRLMTGNKATVTCTRGGAESQEDLLSDCLAGCMLMFHADPNAAPSQQLARVFHAAELSERCWIRTTIRPPDVAVKEKEARQNEPLS